MISRAVVLFVALTVLTPSFAAGQTPVLKLSAGAVVKVATESVHGSQVRPTITDGTARTPEVSAGQTPQAATPQKRWVPRNKALIVFLVIVSVVMGGLVVATRPDDSRD